MLFPFFNSKAPSMESARGRAALREWAGWVSVFVSLLFASGFSASAAEVVVVHTALKKQHQEALLGFRDVVKDAVFLDISKMSEDELRRRLAAENPKVVTAIGKKAQKFAEKTSRVTVVSFMVFSGKSNEKRLVLPLKVTPKEQLLALKKLDPTIQHVGLLIGAKNVGKSKKLHRAAQRLGMTISVQVVASKRDAPKALLALRPHIDALLLLADSTVVSRDFLELLTTQSFKTRLPVLSFSPTFVKGGLLAALAPNYRANGERAGVLSNAIRQGVPVANLIGKSRIPPVFFVNFTTLRRFGLRPSAESIAPPTILIGKR